MVSIPACHAGDRGSIPRRGGLTFCLSFCLPTSIEINYLISTPRFHFQTVRRKLQRYCKCKCEKKYAILLKITQFPDGFRLKNFSRGPFLTNYQLKCWLLPSISYWPLINIASFFKSIRYFELFNHRLFSTLALQNKHCRGIQRPYPPKFIFFHTAIVTTFGLLWSVQQKNLHGATNLFDFKSEF